MNQIFKYARLTLLWLLAISFFIGIASFLYASIPTNFYAGWQYILFSSLACIIAFCLIYRNFLIGAVIPIWLAFQSFLSAYELNIGFSWWLLKNGPTVFIGLIFSILFIVLSTIYIIIGIFRKLDKRNKN